MTPGEWLEREIQAGRLEREVPAETLAKIASIILHGVPTGGRYRSAAPKRWFVYRLFQGQRLMYIGMSGNWEARLAEHQRSKRGQWDRYELEEWSSQDAAIAAEERAIRQERPPLNVPTEYEVRDAEAAALAEELADYLDEV
jgi:predicted GIY-YIG superfamily endonuclease